MSGLAKQSLDDLDVSKLNPKSPQVISRQATVNIGTIGHVAHGKSTVVRGLSGVTTIKFKQEKERNITIRLGYANAKIYKCTDPDMPSPGCYASHPSSHPDEYTDEEGRKWELQLHVSFVDCPGHDILMATMLNGAAVMDAAMLLVAANEPCPQPQTSEHLAAVELLRLKNLLILQNKVELIPESQALEQKNDIRKFVSGSCADKAPLIPISAVLGYNLDVVAEYLCTQIPIPPRDFSSAPLMSIIRSFDVNKPGQEIEDLQGGVAGGSIIRGVLRVGDEIEIRPGVISRDSQGKLVSTPIKSRIVSLHAENNDLQYAVPGGLIGVGTQMDPTLTRSDRLVGHVLGHPGTLPEVFDVVTVKFQLLRKLLGVKTEEDKKGAAGKEEKVKRKIQQLESGEILMINIGSTTTNGKVVSINPDTSTCKLELTSPVCAEIGDKLTLSRRHEKHWRLIGYGDITKGKSSSKN